MPHSILIVDDDPHIRDVVRFALEKSGMTISIATDGKQALRQFDRNVHDLVVLDVGMPEMDGLEVCREIRKTAETPILFLSARDEEIDRILGLEIGGDDYVTKPFSPRELVARVNAILRRIRSAPPSESKPLRHGGLLLDPDARTAGFQNKPIALTALEFRSCARSWRDPDLCSPAN
jgi:two-component system OmpR family response regulator